MADFGDIALIPFPFTDLTQVKRRPALVVSKNNDKREDIVFVAITSRPIASEWACRIDPTAENGLTVPSWVRFDKIVTLSPTIGIGKIGVIDPSFLKANKHRFLSIFGFTEL